MARGARDTENLPMLFNHDQYQEYCLSDIELLQTDYTSRETFINVVGEDGNREPGKGGKHEHLLKSGPLGICNDPFCTTCSYSSIGYTADLNRVRSKRSQEPGRDGEVWSKLSRWLKSYTGVLNPHTKIVQQWNKVFVVSCLVGIFLDPLFFFLLSVDQRNRCIVLSLTGATILTVFRSFVDFIYLLHILLQFRLAYKSASGELVDDPKLIAHRYLKGWFLIDILAVCPLPQIMIMIVLPHTSNFATNSFAGNFKDMFRVIIILQNIPRITRFIRLIAGSSATGFVFETAWANFVLNMFLYVLVGHVVGSCWYLFGIQRVDTCLQSVCKLEASAPLNCKKRYLDCGTGNTHISDRHRLNWINYTIADATCLMSGATFPYGIYQPMGFQVHERFMGGSSLLRESIRRPGGICASPWMCPARSFSLVLLTTYLLRQTRESSWGCQFLILNWFIIWSQGADEASKESWQLVSAMPDLGDGLALVAQYGTILDKYIYSLFWGFLQVSTLAGNLTPSLYIWEALFTMGIAGLGLLMFALLIGNMQNFLQSLDRRRQEMQIRRYDVENYMSRRRLPLDLRKRVRLAERFKWAANHGVEDKEILDGLPEGLLTDIKCFVCHDLLSEIRLFKGMDQEAQEAIFERLQQQLLVTGTQILRKGWPVKRLYFIVRGSLSCVGMNGHKQEIAASQFCGEELLIWHLEHKFDKKGSKRGSFRLTGQHPISSHDVVCQETVDAFVLEEDDVEYITKHYGRLLRTPRVRGILRNESTSYKLWAAVHIQSAWRYWQKKYNQKNSLPPAHRRDLHRSPTQSTISR